MGARRLSKMNEYDKTSEHYKDALSYILFEWAETYRCEILSNKDGEDQDQIIDQNEKTAYRIERLTKRWIKGKPKLKSEEYEELLFQLYQAFYDEIQERKD